MKVSLNSLKQYTTVDLPVDELVEKINQQLGGVEEVINLDEKYQGAVIVKVVNAEQHPNADRLRVCKVDDGGVVQDVPRDDDGYVQVVCGAPNARAGIYAVWLPPKSTVPASFDEKELFVLDARELRGVLSQGMLAAPDELALGTQHDGILEIDPDEWRPNDIEIKPGASFAHVYALDDQIIDIENKMFTHRPDCFGILGVAREVAGIQGQQFTSPEWYINDPVFMSGDGLDLKVDNEAKDLVPRFMLVALKDVEVKPSPLWLQIGLIRLGGKPINNIVDMTNYVMLLTGQPLHAYDYDKIMSHEIGVRLAQKDETLALLNGKTIDLDPADIVITDGRKPIGLAGVMGGSETEVSGTTKNIILECGTFDMYEIRRMSMRHGLFTDAVTRFNKGQSPLQNHHIVSLAIRSIKLVAGGEMASHILDDSQELKPNAPLRVTTTFINERLGTKLDAESCAQLLTNVEFDVAIKDEELTITAPFWRTDIELPEDIVEEIGRLYGFDKLPIELPRRNVTPADRNPLYELKQSIRTQLSRAGANELLTYSFVHENLLKHVGQDPAQAFRLGNALSPDLQYYRLSVLPSLLDTVHANIKAGHDTFTLFEIGKAHHKQAMDSDGLPEEFTHVAAVFAANKKATATFNGAAYYMAQKYTRALGDFVFAPLPEKLDPVMQQVIAPFELSRSAGVFMGEKLIGIVGEFTARTRKALKLPDYSAGFEIAIEGLNFDKKPYRPLSRFPSVTQDVSLKVKPEVSFADVMAVADEAVAGSEYTIDLTPLAIYQPEDNATKTVTLRLNVTSFDKTLNDQEVSKVIDKIADLAAQKIDAERV